VPGESTWVEAAEQRQTVLLQRSVPAPVTCGCTAPCTAGLGGGGLQPWDTLRTSSAGERWPRGCVGVLTQPAQPRGPGDRSVTGATTSPPERERLRTNPPSNLCSLLHLSVPSLHPHLHTVAGMGAG